MKEVTGNDDEARAHHADVKGGADGKRREAQGRREAGPRRRGPWRGLGAEANAGKRVERTRRRRGRRQGVGCRK